MVDGQVRPNKVIDPRIIRAMRSLPRERFVPPHLASLAYADEDVPLPGGRALMEPMVIARLVQLLRVRDGERGLVVGAGSRLRRGAAGRLRRHRHRARGRPGAARRSPGRCCRAWRRAW